MYRVRLLVLLPLLGSRTVAGQWHAVDLLQRSWTAGYVLVSSIMDAAPPSEIVVRVVAAHPGPNELGGSRLSAH
jgi:hypothetical protein